MFLEPPSTRVDVRLTTGCRHMFVQTRWFKRSALLSYLLTAVPHDGTGLFMRLHLIWGILSCLAMRRNGIDAWLENARP